jgi:uncharacterized membrane protein
MEQLSAAVLSLVVMLICDYVWLSYNKDNYSAMVQKVQPHQAMFKVNIAAAVVAYAFVALAFVVIVMPQMEVAISKGASVAQAGLTGGLIGLAIYGIYNATNMAIFKHYDVSVAVMDTLWGMVLFAIASSLYVWLRERTKN